MYMQICKQNIVSIRGMGTVRKAHESYRIKLEDDNITQQAMALSKATSLR